MKYIGTFIVFILLSNNLLCKNQDQKPNILVIVSDDQGWADVGFNGGKDIPTPNLDKLSSQGVCFEAGYASHPYCSPSRAGLLTGRYQHRFGHENNTPYAQDDEEAGLPLDEVLISELLQKNGYKTCAIGKWHLGDSKKFWPNNVGFDDWFGFFGGGMSFWGDIPNKKTPLHGVLRNGEPVSQDELSYLTDDFTNASIEFIDRNKENPFFIYLAYNAPHAPIQAPQKYLNLTEHIEDGHRSAYGAMVAGMDAGIGKVIDKLKKEDIYENTLIFFYSDNGGHLHGASNYPFRGHKGMLFEGGIRVPFLLSWPSEIPPQPKYSSAISALDIYPTILHAANIEVPDEINLDGVNLLPYVLSDTNSEPHDILFWRYSDGKGYAVRKGNYKMIYSGYKEDFFLFDMETDPYEKNNLANENADILEALKHEYTEWTTGTIPSKWQDPHPENIRIQEHNRQMILDKVSAGEKIKH